MIENTSSRDAAIHLMGAMSDGTDKYITDMEAVGQRQLVSGTQMPTEGPWPELVALGFTRGEAVEGDDLFVNATLPEGWSKEPTDHSMWSQIVDERGIKRVAIFYKAAFYDRKAFCRIEKSSQRFASEAMWGEGTVKLPEYWGLLTDDEKTECAAQLEIDLAYELDKRKYFAGNPKGMEISNRHIARLEAFIAVAAAINKESHE